MAYGFFCCQALKGKLCLTSQVEFVILLNKEGLFIWIIEFNVTIKTGKLEVKCNLFKLAELAGFLFYIGIHRTS